MSHRRIRGLISASACSRPECIPRGRARGVKAKGLRFEAAIAKACPKGQHGPWFRFLDSNGPGYCSPDLVFDLGALLLVLEVKLTWTPIAERQIRELYKPVLELALGKPVAGLVVCRNLTGETPRELVIHTLPRKPDPAAKTWPVLHVLRPDLAHLEPDPSLPRLLELVSGALSA